MENLDKLTQDYAAALLKTQDRRQQWQVHAKPYLLGFFNKITERYKLNWKAGSNEMMQNLEAVFLVFDPEPSGIVEQSRFSLAQKVKVGGFLSFSQTRNGQIIVWINFPFIDGMNGEDNKPRVETLETIDPEEINEENCCRFVEKFLDEMIMWENDARDEIGFLRKHR